MTNSSNELMPKMIDLAGQRFDHLLVLSRVPNKGRDTAWLCRCDCGIELDVRTNNLRSGNTKSCGCLLLKQVTSHGRSYTPEYGAWARMIQRCTNPRCPKWRRYGARGIECRFESFEAFLAEAGDRPSPRHSIDRINNDGHYEPGNVQWALGKPQARNRSNNRLLTWQGKTQCLAAWADDRGMCRDVLRCRLRLGWSVERALSQPVKTRRSPSPASSDFQSGGPVLPLS